MKSIALLAILFIVGCSTPANHVKVGVIDPSSRPANTGAFDTVRPGFQPSRAYREIAAFSYAAGTEDEAEAIGAMAQKARAMGADGMIINNPEAPFKAMMVNGPIWRSPDKRIFRANAFVYTEPKTETK